MVTGTNTPQSVVDYMSAIREECERKDCYRVLIEEKLDGPRFDEMEIFALITEGSPDALGFFEAAAATVSETPNIKANSGSNPQTYRATN